MTQDQLVLDLQELGFKAHATASPRWRLALSHANGGKTLFALVRRHGIDLLETTLQQREMVNADGLLSVSIRRGGDRFGELAYTESEVSIHDQVLQVCGCFVRGEFIPDTEYERQGIGPTEWAEKHGKLSNKKYSAEGEMREIYQAVSGEDGEDAYLGDGVWISPSGQLDHRS